MLATKIYRKIAAAMWSQGRRNIKKLYQDLPYLDAYAAHTDLRVEKRGNGELQGLLGKTQFEYLQGPLGRIQFDYLVANGLAPEHRLLDIGCGMLRGGRHFIRYLEADRYTGIDLSAKSLFYAAAVVEHEGLSAKRPRLVLNSDKNLRFEQFAGESFDYLLAQSVFTHLPPEHIEECFAHIRSIMRDGSVFFFTFRESRAYVRRSRKSFRYPASFFAEVAERHGLAIEVRADYPHPERQKMAALKVV